MELCGIKITKMLAVALCGAGLMVVPAAAQQQLLTNGNFDNTPAGPPTTVIPGWTTFNQAGSNGGTCPGGVSSFYLSSSTADPCGANANVGPLSPPHFAVSSESGPSAHALLQTFTVPSNASKVVLSFDMFVNNYDRGPVCTVLDFTAPGGPECGRVDLLIAGAAPLSTAPADIIRNFYAGSDPPVPATPPGNPYTHYSFDITANVVPGGTYQIRFADVEQVFFLNLGVDNVSILATLSDSQVYQLRYLANLDKGDSYVNLTNAGTLNGFDPAGRLCVNVYTFDPAEELISCCACPVTPNGLNSLSARNDLISNTLTPGVPTSITVKLLSSLPLPGNTCNAASPNAANLVRGMRAWATTIHLNTAVTPGVYQETETPFSAAELSASELSKLTGFCAFIQANGSGFGICKSCRAGALGGAEK